jgi:hypothetical protein
MSPDLDKTLQEKYPKLFKNKDLPATQTLICFGCECRDGWFSLLDHLFGYLTEIMGQNLLVNTCESYRELHKNDKDYRKNHSYVRLLPPAIVLDQVKEKFGTLRVYHHAAFETDPLENPELQGKIDAEDLKQKLSEYHTKIHNAIDYAEYQSSRTCEVTGKEGRLYTQGWHSVLCDEEAAKQNLKPQP